MKKRIISLTLILLLAFSSLSLRLYLLGVKNIYSVSTTNTLKTNTIAKTRGNVYDRNLLRLASDDSGINEELFAKADEHMKQSLLFKVSQKVYKGELIGPESDDFTSNENLFNYQAKVLKELAFYSEGS